MTPAHFRRIEILHVEDNPGDARLLEEYLVEGLPDGFTIIGAGYLPDFGPDTGYNNPTLILGLIVAIAIVWKFILQPDGLLGPV